MKARKGIMDTYFGDWNCKEEMESDFNTKITDEIHILVACYDYQNYSGSAVVIFEKERNLYIVEGSHCSCYGLEGQWLPEKINREFLKHKAEKGSFIYTDSSINEEVILNLKSRGML